MAYSVSPRGSTDPASPRFSDKGGAWVDLGLTLPIFTGYHLGVIFLQIRNASDIVTGEILKFAEGDRTTYLLITVGIGAVFSSIFAILGRGQTFTYGKFFQIALEGVVYAVGMRIASASLVNRIFAGAVRDEGVFVGTVMSLGAGFYEEMTYRVLLFGLGAKVLVWLFAQQSVGLEGTVEPPRFSMKAFAITTMWATVAACVFSAVHYIGPYGDSFELTSFAFRAILGMMLTLIYVFRGFAAAVWTHAVYDIWVLVF